jgi:hypothetical protein
MTLKRKGQVKACGSTFVKLKKTNFLLFLSKGKHWCIPPPLEILLYNCPLSYYFICAFML